LKLGVGEEKSIGKASKDWGGELMTMDYVYAVASSNDMSCIDE